MIDLLTIQSNDGESRLVLSGAERDHLAQLDYAMATLVLNGMVARTRICLHHGVALINLFEDLAAAPQNWNGEKYAETVEGELRLKCTNDKLGNCALEVSLRSIPNYWLVKGVMLVDNGQCERITRDLKQFFNFATAVANKT